MTASVARELRNIYRKLYCRFGPQHWWPGRTRFEIIVGAILTQNTNWTNVEKAIRNLRQARLLNPRRMQGISLKKLASLIRPSGYYNIKARRLKNFVAFIFREYDGSLARMAREPLEILREKILSVSGIGPETADSILLYAFDKPIFVIDAYTQRIVARHPLVKGPLDYDRLQGVFMNHLPHDPKLFNEYHALLVRLGKEFCRKTRLLCDACPLREDGK